MKNICASCKSITLDKVVKTNNDMNPEWLEEIDYVTQFINSKELIPYIQKGTNMKISLNLGKKNYNRLVLYWAAEPSDKGENDFKLKNAKEAYLGEQFDDNSFSNYGVGKCDKDGNIIIKLNCPQPYWTREKGKKTDESYYRHFHFCYSNIKHTRWLSEVFTKVVIYSISLKDTMSLHKKGNIVLINALPCEYYGKDHIPNSFNLPVNVVKKMSESDLINWFSEVISINYPKINKHKDHINIQDVPIIVYCAHSDCSAGHDCAIELMKKNFINVRDFQGGMKEYKQIK